MTVARPPSLLRVFVWTVDQWQIERLWLFLRGFDSRRSNQVLVGVRLVGSRWSLKPASGVRFVHSQPQRGRSAARISGSDPEDSGSSPLPAAKEFSRGRRSTGQDTRLRTERLEGSSPSARTISRPLVQRTGHSPPKAGIGVRLAGGRP